MDYQKMPGRQEQGAQPLPMGLAGQVEDMADPNLWESIRRALASRDASLQTHALTVECELMEVWGEAVLPSVLLNGHERRFCLSGEISPQLLSRHQKLLDELLESGKRGLCPCCRLQ